MTGLVASVLAAYSRRNSWSSASAFSARVRNVVISVAHVALSLACVSVIVSMATSCRRSRSSIDGSGASESDFAILSASSVAERSETSASSRLRLSNASESCSLRFSALESSSSRRKPDAFAASRALRSWFLCVNSTNSSLSFSHRTRSRRSSCRFWSETDSLRSNSRILSLHSSSFAVRSRSARSLSRCTVSK